MQTSVPQRTDSHALIPLTSLKLQTDQDQQLSRGCFSSPSSPETHAAPELSSPSLNMEVIFAATLVIHLSPLSSGSSSNAVREAGRPPNISRASCLLHHRHPRTPIDTHRHPCTPTDIKLKEEKEEVSSSWEKRFKGQCSSVTLSLVCVCLCARVGVCEVLGCHCILHPSSPGHATICFVTLAAWTGGTLTFILDCWCVCVRVCVCVGALVLWG